MLLVEFRAPIGCQRLHEKLLKLRVSSLDHAVCDAIIPRGLVRVEFFDFISEFLWFDVLVKERVNREGRALHFMQCLLFTSRYPMSNGLIVGGLFMFLGMMS